MADFHSKMSVCRHELGGSPPQPPDNSNPAKHNTADMIKTKIRRTLTIEVYQQLVRLYANKTIN